MKPEFNAAAHDLLFEQYCLPGGRYKKLLSGSFMRLRPDLRTAFGIAMLRDVRGMTDETLATLFDGDWRECLTAAWLAGFGGRIFMRQAISARLAGRRERHVGKGLCFSLARFSAPGDAEVLVDYLTHSLSDLSCRSVQPWALGALMVIEERLGVESSGQFLGSSGKWEQWAGEDLAGGSDPQYWKDEVLGWCRFASSIEQEVEGFEK
ncbi:DUF6000 family protein [Kitasatospora sp. NPDC058965]|uniref:DUF6000 family protein n=1 Tax=Kitasatospora sp. NPDC058965 TaxID=3346682 RepID=UPI0036D14DCA